MSTIIGMDGVEWTLNQQPPSWNLSNERGQIAGGITIECTPNNEGRRVYISSPDMPLDSIPESMLLDMIAKELADTD